MKSLKFLLLMVLATTSCSADNMMIKEKGTVRYINVEGGFYGIVGDGGNNYDPVNLPSEFKQDNLKVKFKARPLKDRVSFHMWGEIVEIESITKEE